MDANSQILETLRTSFKDKVAEAPKFSLIDIEKIKPKECVINSIECSQTLDHISDCLAEIPIIRNQIITLRKELVESSIQYEEMEFQFTLDWFNNIKESLEQRQKTLSSHSTILRGLISALNKNPDLASAVAD